MSVNRDPRLKFGARIVDQEFRAWNPQTGKYELNLARKIGK